MQAPNVKKHSCGKKNPNTLFEHTATMKRSFVLWVTYNSHLSFESFRIQYKFAGH